MPHLKKAAKEYQQWSDRQQGSKPTADRGRQHLPLGVDLPLLICRRLAAATDDAG